MLSLGIAQAADDWQLLQCAAGFAILLQVSSDISLACRLSDQRDVMVMTELLNTMTMKQMLTCLHTIVTQMHRRQIVKDYSTH